MQRAVLSVASVIGVVLLAGCQPPGPDYRELNLVEVTGQVTLDGRPLPDVSVRFEGPPGRFAEGKTDTAGNFRLMYDSNQPGCTSGDRNRQPVRCRWRPGLRTWNRLPGVRAES